MSGRVAEEVIAAGSQRVAPRCRASLVPLELQADIWEAIVIGMWQQAGDSMETALIVLPSVVALACTCRPVRDALHPFLATRTRWVLGIREQASMLLTQAKPQLAEALLERHLFGCRLLLGRDHARTLAAMDSLARLKISLSKDVEALRLVGLAAEACRQERVWRADTAKLRWDWEAERHGEASASGQEEERSGPDWLWAWAPAGSLSSLHRVRSLLDLSAADAAAKLARGQGGADERRLANSRLELCLQQLLGASRSRVATRGATEYLESAWVTIDVMLAAGLVGPAEVLARELEVILPVGPIPHSVANFAHTRLAPK